jgi:formiminoglutamase
MPHTGIEIPPELTPLLVSGWLARKDTDWWVDRLYGFAADLGATIVRTGISRSVVDANRDPSGASLYPGQATTELCPTTSFDGEPLYQSGQVPDAAEIDRRRKTYFEPYHAAIGEELERLRRAHSTVVLYDCHSIRSVIPRLFSGELPNFNIGTHDGRTCSSVLTAEIESVCDLTPWSRVTNGRFKGGYTARHYGIPQQGMHAVQMELACRSYLNEPQHEPTPQSWPADFDEAKAAPLRATLEKILRACITFASAAK